MSAEPQLPRFGEPGSEAPDELQALLREGRAPLGTAEEVAQLSQGLGQLLGASAGLSATSLTAPAASAGLALGRWAAWAAVGISSAAAVWYFSAEPAKLPAPIAPPPAVLSPPAPPAREPVVEPPAPVVAESPVAEPPVAEPPVAQRAPRSAARARAGGSEAELLRRAQSALGASPARALALTAEHQRRFGAGALAEEREALAIEALRRLGRTPEAQRRAAAFTRRYPHSVHASRVRGTAPSTR
jgi:hypothetical protein